MLLHGYAESSRMWLPLIKELEKTHTVIAPDLRGAGASSTPADGYTKTVMAQDIHALVASLGYKKVEIVGHDIGLMVAYAYAAQYPTEVSKIALMDAFLPGVGDWTHVWVDARFVAFPLLRQNAAGAGEGTRAYLSGTFLE